jgi:hypothetical protein
MEQLKKDARVAAIEDRKVRDISRTPAGQLLREKYEQKFDMELSKWLANDPGDAIAAVQAHTVLNQIRELLANITPSEKEPKVDE